ncbi:hypothetical protein [Nitrosomonas marina]|uniref:Uncharacterized protein n=1 Tax=Nitrosomonas marina TaxID=917 RepID=A0A1H8IWQ2_9PROT|nr:hypothetical protein [Nitrosomonas marina]SEN72871.1 hypothetical protein SAMN05216325_1436 [Nitrosomonas marina]
MNWRENLLAMAFNLSLYANTPMPDALSMPVSLAESFFKSKQFEDWNKSRESEAKAIDGIGARINNVIRAINALAKSLPRG